jgi:heavy metal sensor kinase
MFSSIRFKLTLWYTAILTLILVVCGISVHSLVKHKLREKLDENLVAALETVDNMIASEGEESDFGGESMTELIAVLRFPDMGLAISDRTGKKIAERADTGYMLPPILPLAWLGQNGTQLITWEPDMPGPKTKWRIAIRMVRLERSDHLYFAAGVQSQKTIENQLDTLDQIFFLIMPAAILLAGLSGWLFAKKSFAPVAALTERVQHIYANNLDQRLPIKQPQDEIGRLAQTFNELLSRLQAAFLKERQFMADAAHELRTPLYVARTAADVTLKQPQRSAEEYREALTMISQQERRLTRIVEDLFLLSCADDRGRRLELSDFSLNVLLHDSVQAIQVLAEQKGIRLDTVVNAPETIYRGDECLLRQMLTNVLDNAVKFTPVDGTVRVSFRSAASSLMIEVADSGPGIPEKNQPFIFERFYRGDQARSRADTATGTGAGLGLPIAQWIAAAHGGSLCLSRSDALGSVFTILLPGDPDQSFRV